MRQRPNEPTVVNGNTVSVILTETLRGDPTHNHVKRASANERGHGRSRKGRRMSFHQKINMFLAEWVSAINALVAVGIPALSALGAGSVAGNAGFGGFSIIGFLGGFIAGGLAGILVAGSLCGVLAVLIDIRNSLAAQRPERSRIQPPEIP